MTKRDLVDAYLSLQATTEHDQPMSMSSPSSFVNGSLPVSDSQLASVFKPVAEFNNDLGLDGLDTATQESLKSGCIELLKRLSKSRKAARKDRAQAKRLLSQKRARTGIRLARKERLDVTRKKLMTLNNGPDDLVPERSTDMTVGEVTTAEVTEEPTSSLPEDQVVPQLPSRCYTCRNKYSDVHHFYDQLCPKCGDLNYTKRGELADLTGKVAIVTGGRVKIGFETALKLLLCGAQVIVTTRYPNDALVRFMGCPNFKEFAKRLTIYGLDLRDLAGINTFCMFVERQFSRLDILINNAAQTIKRSQQFEFLEYHREKTAAHALCNAPERKMIASDGPAPAIKSEKLDMLEGGAELGGLLVDPMLVDEHGQLMEPHLKSNTWTSKLEDVPEAELFEVHAINYVAPCLLVQKLHDVMKATAAVTGATFIIQVQAMEGKFNTFKTGFHPHTNAAKAALNMITRTSSKLFSHDGIYMNSVDTGWVTDEYPLGLQTARQFRVSPPLDELDGAARVLDPIITAHTSESLPTFGRFYKDYAESEW